MTIAFPRGVRPLIVLLFLSGFICAAGCTMVRSTQATEHLGRGEQALADEDLETAVQEFEAAVQLDPKLTHAHAQLGKLHERMGNYERALAAFANAVRTDPLSFDNTFNLARLYHFTKRLREAIQAYLRALDLKPNDFDSNLNLGVCYQQVGELQQAIERFEKAIQIDNERPHAFVNLGVAYDSQGKYYQAIQAYKQALERYKQNDLPYVLVNLGRTYMKLDRLKIARSTLETAIEMDENLAPAHEALGYCMFRLKDYEASEQAYRKAILHDDKLPHAYAGLGSIYAMRYLQTPKQRQLRDHALEYWHRSLELDPDQPRIRKLVDKYQPRGSDPDSVLLTGGKND